jgi:hypothetical protein
MSDRDPNRLANRYWDRGGGTGSIHPKAKAGQKDALALNPEQWVDASRLAAQSAGDGRKAKRLRLPLPIRPSPS